jgi:phage gp29-like protein
VAQKKNIANIAQTVSQPAAAGVVKADMSAGTAATTSQDVTQRLGQPQVQQILENESLIGAASVYLYRQARFQPIAQLDPQSLSWQLSEWNVGTMRRFSLTMDAIENRDAVTKSVTGKLKHSLSRRSLEVVKVEGLDDDDQEAQAHQDALKFFYNNLEATNAVDRNIRGGQSMLIEQMMDAALKKYAVHEIIWKPAADGQNIKATFVFIPLWFFENRTGSLRFCGNFAWDGIPLKDGNWCVTVGDGIMEAISVAWMYKTISLRDWLIYSEKHGMPAIVGKTAYQVNSKGWQAISEAVKAVSTDFSAVIGATDTIEAVQFGQTGQLPYPPLVEYMDKAISAIARGADLSTMSAHGHSQQSGQGASLQGDESDLIEQHYGQMITETLNHYVDRKVLEWHFGEGVEPKAYVKLNVPKRKDVANELAIDQFLVSAGVKLSASNACERYARSEASDEQVGEGDILQAPAAPPGGGDGTIIPPDNSGTESPTAGLSAERTAWLKGNRDAQQGGAPMHPSHPRAQMIQNFRKGASPQPSAKLSPKQKFAAFRASRTQLGSAADKLAQNATNELQPLVNRLEKILAMPNDEHYVAAITALRHDIPDIAASCQRTIGNAQGLLTIHEIVTHPFLQN